MKESLLRERIVEEISKYGFSVNGSIQTRLSSKEEIKLIHRRLKKDKINKHKNFIKSHIDLVKKYSIKGKELEVDKISLSFKVAQPGNLYEKVYKWYNFVWWSMPYQKAYGRQIRLVIWDDYHNTPFGIVGLQSPVLRMKDRDKYLGIPKSSLDYWVNRSMQAQRVGAVPPYNQLIGGKLAALSLTAKEIRDLYIKKYYNNRTELNQRLIDPNLLFITTTSAYGRSSMYNRLKMHGREVGFKIGQTKGSGTFHISDCLFEEIKKYLSGLGISTSTSFGSGPSRKIKLLHIAFKRLGLPDYSFHNVRRELYYFPLAENVTKVISENASPLYFNEGIEEMTSFWKERWGTPRSIRNKEFRQFDFNEQFNSFL